MGPFFQSMLVGGRYTAVALYALLLLIQLGVAAILAGLSISRRTRARAFTAPLETMRGDAALNAIGARAICVPASRRPPLPDSNAAARLHARAVERLKAVVRRTSSSARQRVSAVGALIVASRSGTEADTPELCAALFSPDEAIRSHAAVAVAAHPDQHAAAMVPLLSALRGASLGRATFGWAVEKMLARYPEQIVLLASDPSAAVRELVVESCGKLILRGRSGAERDAAQHWLALSRAALNDRAPNVRAAACRALGLRDSDENLPLLLPLLHDADNGVVDAAVRALVAMRTDAAMSALLERLRTADEPLSARILRAMADGKGRAPAGAVRLTESGAADPVLCDFISFGMADANAIKALMNMAADEDDRRRIPACVALSRIARRADSPLTSENTTAALLTILEEQPDEETTGAVLDVLAASAAESVVPELMRRIPSSGRFVREKIVETVATIGFLSQSRRRLQQRRGEATVVAR